MDDDNNVFRFGTIDGGKTDTKPDSIPENNYVVIDIDNEEYFTSGFLIFTQHHLAIMRDTGDGAVPALVIPLSRVKVAEIFEEDENDVAT